MTLGVDTQSVVALLTTRLAAERFTRTPWPHLYVADALPAEYASELSADFPSERLTPSARSNSDKDYSLWSADLTDHELRAGLTPGWAKLLAALASTEYRSLLARLSGVNLTDATTTLTCWEYRGGDFLSPHVDKAEKVLTQVIYLSGEWTEGNGGRLRIQHTPDVADTVTALAPVLGASAILVRSEDSWHSVEESAASVAPRCSLNLTYWRGADD
ncbi:2OG-Fe(II) oxygenase [Micromonospora phytophila]|uniref:2OG-Fe(II) oxygenase n=1 Tax=Micromonospora phytophila TaxID=709888 RepID=UPI00202EE7DB|nr:2OG-Fe(II) oxygenase [Micromonospora phytophila]MCM0674134.1 2OG-Fe(II) oxygenase [Micromonospora phytophila]